MIGFAEMAEMIGSKWKSLTKDDKKKCTVVAAVEKERYRKELDSWREEEKTKSMHNAIASSKKRKRLLIGGSEDDIGRGDGDGDAHKWGQLPTQQRHQQNPPPYQQRHSLSRNSKLGEERNERSDDDEYNDDVDNDVDNNDGTQTAQHLTQSTVVETPGPYDIVCGRNNGA